MLVKTNNKYLEGESSTGSSMFVPLRQISSIKCYTSGKQIYVDVFPSDGGVPMRKIFDFDQKQEADQLVQSILQAVRYL